MTATTEQAHPVPTRRISRTEILLLGFLVVTALIPRAYHLGRESVWFDEHNSLGYVGAPTVTECLRAQSTMNTSTVPLYFVIQYYWAHWIGSSALSVRWLSILFSLATVPLLYALGRRLYGRWAGTIAALYFALSPFQIYYGQSIRFYSLLTFLGVLSMFAFFEWTGEGRKRWLLLNIVTGQLMMWTHIFASWLLVAQGCLLLVFHGREVRRWLAWGTINGILLIPVAWVVMGWTNPPPPGALPNGYEILSQLYGADVEQTRWCVWHLRPDTIEYALPGAVWWLVNHFTASRHLLIGVLIGCTVLFALQTFVAAVRSRKDATGAPSPRKGARPFAFLIGWHLLPTLLLYAFALSGNPSASQYRYTIYSQPALFLIAGASVACMPRRFLKTAATAIILGTLVPQTYLALSIPLRTNYLGAAQYVRSTAAPSDVIVVLPAMQQPTFEYSLGAPPCHSANAVSMIELLQAVDSAADEGHRAIAVLIDAMNDMYVPAGRESRVDLVAWYASQRGIACERRHFFGQNEIDVCVCAQGPDYRPLTAPESISRLAAALTQAPEPYLYRIMLADALQGAQRFDEAAAECEKTLAAIPRDAAQRQAMANAHNMPPDLVGKILDRYIVQAIRQLGRASFAAGRADEAAQAYIDCLGFLENSAVEPWTADVFIMRDTPALVNQLVDAGFQDAAERLSRATLEHYGTKPGLDAQLNSLLKSP